MGRRKMFPEWHVPSSVVHVVRAVCEDYYRRNMMISQGEINGLVLDEYVRLNSAIDTALGEIEEIFREEILANVADGAGYDGSFINYLISRRAYYNRKNKFIHDVAVQLRLI